MIPLALVRKDSITYLHTVGKNILFRTDNLQHLENNREQQSLKAFHFYNSVVTEK